MQNLEQALARLSRSSLLAWWPRSAPYDPQLPLRPPRPIHLGVRRGDGPIVPLRIE